MSTKKLAKELGLLRQRSQSSNGSKKTLVSNQIFSYLIVIDFESTCWREKNNYTQEIIEFPGVLLNTSTGEVESEFHTYVQPQEHPTLSEFCTELTGITQMQVEAGIPLQICLSQFSRWLQNLQLNMGVVFSNNLQRSSASQKLCTFLTWSDWDLGVCLQYECKRKQLPKPDVLNSWIDLRSTYKLFYDRKPKGLNGALQDLGIQFAGREHSGLDDARNTAQLAARMMRDGCVMKITRSLTRTPLMVKPMLGKTAADKKGKPNTDKGENTTAANTSSFSTSCQMKSFSELFTRDLDKNKNSDQYSVPNCQSLVSPKTLLNGSSMLLGGKSLSTEVVTNITSPVMRNCHSSHGNNSLVLCSTIAGGLFNQPSKTGAAVEEEFAEPFSVETEDRCGSYDDVVLEGHDEVISVTERESHYDYVSDFDSGNYLCEEPESTGSTGFQVTLWDNIRVNNSKPKKMTKESAMVSLPMKTMICHGNVYNGLNETRQQSTITESSTLVVRDSAMVSLPTKTMTCCGGVHNGSNETRQQSTITESSSSLVVQQQKIGLKTSVQVHEEANIPQKNTKTNTQFMFEKTSPRNSSFAKPKAVVAQRKQTPKSSFSIYNDPEKSSHPSSARSVYLSKQVLTSLSTNTLPSRTSGSVKGEQRITSPLCLCGRRAKRQVVSNGGPNHGRGFYCCPVRRCGSGGRVQKGCEFFKWESALIKSGSVASPAIGSSVSLCQINSSVNCRPPQMSMIRKSY